MVASFHSEKDDREVDVQYGEKKLSMNKINDLKRLKLGNLVKAMPLSSEELEQYRI